jgi:hypothetical protein
LHDGFRIVCVGVPRTGSHAIGATVRVEKNPAQIANFQLGTCPDGIETIVARFGIAGVTKSGMFAVYMGISNVVTIEFSISTGIDGSLGLC